jgi:hypothetical protein
MPRPAALALGSSFVECLARVGYGPQCPDRRPRVVHKWLRRPRPVRGPGAVTRFASAVRPQLAGGEGDLP